MNAEQIKAARSLLGMGQFDFAKNVLGCQRYRLSLLENGHAEAKDGEVKAIRKALETAANNAEAEVRQRRQRIAQVLHAVAV